MKKILTSSFAIFIVFLMVVACSKDRSIILEDVKPSADTIKKTPTDSVKVIKNIKDYSFSISNSQALFDSLAPKSEIFTINKASDLPVTTKNGMKVSFSIGDCINPNGKIVTFPIELEVLALLTPKDMILHQKPTVSYGRLLTTGGEFLIKVRKDKEELNLRFYNGMKVSVPIKGTPDAEMGLFYGQSTSDGRVEWLFSNPDSLRQREREIWLGKGFYEVFPRTLGWINCDKFYNFTGPKTKIKFTSAYPDLNVIKVFLYFPHIKSVMQVYTDTSGDVPVGQAVKVICIAPTTNGIWYSYIRDLNVSENQVVNIELTQTTEKAVLDYLKNLN